MTNICSKVMQCTKAVKIASKEDLTFEQAITEIEKECSQCKADNQCMQ